MLTLAGMDTFGLRKKCVQIGYPLTYSPSTRFYLYVDEDGSETGAYIECNEDNNQAVWTEGYCE